MITFCYNPKSCLENNNFWKQICIIVSILKSFRKGSQRLYQEEINFLEVFWIVRLWLFFVHPQIISRIQKFSEKKCFLKLCQFWRVFSKGLGSVPKNNDFWHTIEKQQILNYHIPYQKQFKKWKELFLLKIWKTSRRANKCVTRIIYTVLGW